MFIRVYNYNTMDKIKVFEAHADYIRCVAVHPTLPYVLSSSDDMLIKLWDWEKDWLCTQIFEGHSHYVMQVTFNPKDTNTFASASLDRSIKVRDSSFTPKTHVVCSFPAGEAKHFFCFYFFSYLDMESWFSGSKFYFGCTFERGQLC